MKKNIPFEIHITGDQTINKVLDDLKIKNIIVELLGPDLSKLREEYMSSFVVYLPYNEIHQYVFELVQKLKDCNIIRVKIESPPIEELFPVSIYMESHFDPDGNSKYPISRNKFSQRMMATDREYNKNSYKNFMNFWEGEDIELCIFDSFKEEDFDWFKLYKL